MTGSLMTGFLQVLYEEIGYCTRIVPPTEGEKEEDEKVIGEADENMQKVYSLYIIYDGKVEAIEKKHHEMHEARSKDDSLSENERFEAEHKALVTEHRQLVLKRSLLREIFWTMVKHDLSNGEPTGLYVKPDWKIVSFSPKSPVKGLSGIAVLSVR